MDNDTRKRGVTMSSKGLGAPARRPQESICRYRRFLELSRATACPSANCAGSTHHLSQLSDKVSIRNKTYYDILQHDPGLLRFSQEIQCLARRGALLGIFSAHIAKRRDSLRDTCQVADTLYLEP